MVDEKETNPEEKDQKPKKPEVKPGSKPEQKPEAKKPQFPVKPEPKVKAQAESPDKIPKADNRAGAQETVAPDPASMPADQEKSVPKQV